MAGRWPALLSILMDAIRQGGPRAGLCHEVKDHYFLKGNLNHDCIGYRGNGLYRFGGGP